MPLIVPSYQTVSGRSWHIRDQHEDRIDYPNIIERYNEETYQEEILPSVRGCYFTQIIERHIRIHNDQPHPLVYIPPTAPLYPFRITEPQFNALFEVPHDDAFILYAFELIHLLFADGHHASSDWTTTRLTHKIFWQATAIANYRTQILNDLENITRNIAIVRSHVYRVIHYYRYLKKQLRLYDTLKEVFFEAIIRIRSEWEGTFGRAFPNDDERAGPWVESTRIPGYVEPHIDQDIRHRETWDSEEEEGQEGSEPYVWDQHYYGYLRWIHRQRRSFLLGDGHQSRQLTPTST